MKRLFFVVDLAGLLLAFIFAPLALADEPLIGEIRMYAGPNFVPGVGYDPPPGWLNCNGNCFPVATYPELFSVISYTYGSSGGGSSFCLPSFIGKLPMGAPDYVCSDPGCFLDCGSPTCNYDLGDTGGEINHTLTITEMPRHSHDTKYILDAVTTGGGNYRQNPGGASTYSNAVLFTGGGGAHNNMPPYLAVNFIIAYTTTQTTPTPTPTPTVTPTATTTPTNTPTPTATPVGMATPDAFTYTLDTGKTLYQPVEMSFGQIIISSVGAGVVATNILMLVIIRRRRA